MKKFKFVASLLFFLSYESSAALMQLTYDHFYAPVSPTNFPVDTTGAVSFVFDGLAEDTNLDPLAGNFLNPIKSGYIELSGVRYDIDTAMPTEFITNYSGYSGVRATGTMFNSETGARDSFFLSFYGDYSEAIGDSIDNLDLSGSWSHYFSYGNNSFYEAGSVVTEVVVDIAAQTISVPEPSALLLLVLGMAGTVLLRMKKIKGSAF